MTTEKWLHWPRAKSNASLSMFCFPYACAGTQIFHQWPSFLPLDVDVCGIQLPGRGFRINEEPYTDIFKLVEDVCKAILMELDGPYVLFGHSMGAMLAYEVAKELHRMTGVWPEQLIVSAYRAPTIIRTGKKYHKTTDREFMAKINSLGGIPSSICNDSELIDLFLPVFRADFALIENYPFGNSKPVSCDITAFAGTCDPEASIDEVDAWKLVTNGNFKLRQVIGGHFFIHEAQAAFLDQMSSDLMTTCDSLNSMRT